jgi:DNA-binding HxlR family transcriptional regulator
MRSYGQYCPIAKAAETLGDRWTVLIVRELGFGVDRFNELHRCLPGISRSVLSQRLRHLERVGIIERRSTTYRLTPAGQDLRPVLRELGNWAARWAFGEPDPRELDPDLVIRWMSRHVAADALPGRRVVTQFDLTGPRPRRYWLVLERTDVSVCLHDPGFPVDVFVAAATAVLYDVYLGRRALPEAIRDGLVTVSGAPALVRAFPSWLTGSDFAPAVRQGVARRPLAVAGPSTAGAGGHRAG